MLKTIAIVTLVVRSLATVEPAYQDHLGYSVVERGTVPREITRTWDAPAMTGRPFLLLQPESGAQVYLRFIEAPPGSAEVRPFMTHGWNAMELLVTDPDATAACYERDDLRAGDVLTGPAVVWETNSTTFVPAGRQAVVGTYGELVVT